MRWTRWMVVGMSIGAALTAAFAVSCTANRTSSTSSSDSTATAMTAEQKIARGHVIAYSSGCVDCHTPGTFYGTPDTTRMLSGSELGWEGPWGVTYPRNLTPDMETGIGSWTEDQIVTAFRTGQRPDKSPLLPPMPWPAYAYMSDDDAYALAAYLKSLPPVSHKAPDRLPPGKGKGPRLSFPPPPTWDAQNLPPPPTDAAPTNAGK